jgi:hypothetical protein
MGPAGHLHGACRLRLGPLGDADAPRAGMAPGRAARARRRVGRRGAAGRALQPRGRGGALDRHPPAGLPGLRAALALAAPHEHRPDRRPDRQRAEPAAQRAGPLLGPQRRRAPGHRAGGGRAGARRRGRAGLRRGHEPGRRPPRGGRAAPARAGRRALHAHSSGAALHAGPAPVRAAGGLHVGRARAQRGCRLGDRRRRAGRRDRSDRRATDRSAVALGRLPRLGGHSGPRPRRQLQLESDLRPVALAADRPRGVQRRSGHRRRLLEGRGPGHLQRLQLGGAERAGHAASR